MTFLPVSLLITQTAHQPEAEGWMEAGAEPLLVLRAGGWRMKDSMTRR